MRRKKINLKAIVCALMSGAMIMASVAPASAATARATTMKLEKIEGTVTLKTQNGSARKITKGMRLYNGNTLATAKYSYAHISLDSTKAVKLDQSSSATLRQSGKQLELLVKSGKLFFNVSSPLTEKEDMNIRTSTMVTGIRGTCGAVEYVDVNKSKLYLIEGQVTLGSGDNATTVYGGQTATVVLQPKQETGGSEQPGGENKPGESGETDKEMEQKVMVETLTEEQIPPVALQEIVADPILQAKIEQTTKLKIEKIEEALEQFEKEEAERIEQEKAEQENEEEKDQEEQDEKKEDESTTSSGGGSYTPSTPVITETTLSGTVTPGAIEAAFQDYQRVHIGADATMVFSANDTLTIPGGKMLHIWGKKEIPTTTTITVGDGTTQGLLCIVESASFTAGTINVLANSRLEDHGTLICASVDGGASTTLINNKELTVNGTMHLSNGAIYENHGTLTGNNLTSDGGATIKNTSLISLSGVYTSTGTDTYGDTEEALLISTNTSTGMPTGNQNGSLLMSAGNSYYYARSINQLVRENMKIAGTGVTWQFAKNAEISAGDTVEFADFNANMYGNELQILGELTLSGSTNITGTGSATVRLKSGGKLILSGESTSSVIGNMGSGSAVVSDGGTFEWNDIGCYIAGETVSAAIASAKSSDSNTRAELPSWVTVKTGYVPIWTGSQIQLQIPEIFTSGNVTVDELNLSLSTNQTVTFGSEAKITLRSGDKVTVPNGKTLDVQAKITEITGGYAYGFNMLPGSVLDLEDGATLKVTNTVGMNGTINVGNNAAVLVEDNGKLQADAINLAAGSKITNHGTIDGGKITSAGSSCIVNCSLIKLTAAYTITGTSEDEYQGNEDSAVVSGQESTAMPGDSLLAVNSDQSMYCYASQLNANVAAYMNDSTWTFSKDAIVPSTENGITLTNFNADLGAYKLQVQGTLTLTGTVSISGEGSQTSDGNDQCAVIYLTGSGILNFDEKVSGTISNISKLENYYVIAADTTVQNARERVNWLSASLSITTGTQKVQYTIQGIKSTADSTGITAPSYLKLPDNVTLQFQNGTLSFPIQD